MREDESYTRAVERLHANGCEVLAIDRPRGYVRAVVVAAGDGTTYRVDADDLPTFADPATVDLAPWILPPTCAACGEDLDHVDVDRGARMTYPYCMHCHYSGRAGNHRHADVLAACERAGLVAYVEQTGGGCMNLRVHRDHGDAYPSTFDADVVESRFVPSIVAVGASRDDAGTWSPDDASLPEPGAPWCAFPFLQPTDETGETFADESTWGLPLDADGVAAFADSVLPPT